MLVLSRRLQQTVNFPGLGIQVKVLQVNGSNVRLGIKAPHQVSILRGELDFLGEQDEYEMEVPLDQLSMNLKQSA